MIPFELKSILVFLVALFGSIFIIPKLSNIAIRIGLVDVPYGRKDHPGPRPLVGGIGIVISATFCCLVFVPISGLRGFFLGLSVLLFAGFLDDFRELGPYQKFTAQVIACALLMYFSHITLLSFGNLIGEKALKLPDWDLIIWLVTIFCIVGVINALNMIDGLDGLAGGVSFIAFIAFAIHASFVGQYSLMFLNLAFAGSVLGCLRYNWYPAKLFMGDAGSICIGFSLGYMSIALTQNANFDTPPVVALLILSVPIVDTVVVMAKRILRGESPFVADRYHLHHILLNFGLNKIQSVKVILCISSFLAILSFASPIFNLSDRTMFAIFIVYTLCYLGATFYMLLHVRQSPHTLQVAVRSKKTKFLSLLDIVRIIRRSNRYDVYLQCVCMQVSNDDSEKNGWVKNISNDGFLFVTQSYFEASESFIARITFPFEHYTHIIELPCQRIWFAKVKDDEWVHGFRFLQFDGMQEQLLFKFLVKQKAKSS